MADDLKWVELLNDVPSLHGEMGIILFNFIFERRASFQSFRSQVSTGDLKGQRWHGVSNDVPFDVALASLSGNHTVLILVVSYSTERFSEH